MSRVRPAAIPLISVAFVLVAFSPPSVAQGIGHGTFFAAGFTPDYAVVAIDSRETAGGVVDDRYCKIRPLSRNTFFFARGVTSATDDATHAGVFDVRDIARNVYVQFGSGTTRLAELAQAWAAQTERVYNTRPVAFARYARDDIMADGFFVGMDAGGNVAFGAQTIRLAPGSPRFVDAPEPQPPVRPDPAVFPTFASEYFDIIREFANGGETARAKDALARLGPLPDGTDGIAARYAAYVAAVRDWSGDVSIGGDVATIILERGHDWRWFHRPDFCPEN